MKDMLSAEKIGYAFHTSVAYFWTLSSFVKRRVLAYVFDREQADNQCWHRDADPSSAHESFFRKPLNIL